MWRYLCLLSWGVGVTCAGLLSPVGATLISNSSDKTTPSATKSAASSVVHSSAFIPLPLIRNGSTISTGVNQWVSGLPQKAFGSLFSSVFHVRPPRIPKPSTDSYLRDYTASIVKSFVRELRLRHVAITTIEAAISCKQVAHALFMSPMFVSVSCGAVRDVEAQLVVLVIDDTADNVTHVGDKDAQSLQHSGSSLKLKTGRRGRSTAGRARRKKSAENRNRNGLPGGYEQNPRVLENDVHLQKAASGTPPDSKILVLSSNSRVPLLPIPNVHLYLATVQRYGAVIREAWTFPDDPRPVVELRGHWTPSEGLWMEPRQHGGPRDFQGRTLRVAILEDPPYVTVDNSSGQSVLGGYLPGVLDMLATGLNFTPQIVSPADGKFGVELPNGSWSGMVGMLQKQRAELMLASLAMLEHRRRVVRYLGPVEWTYYGFLIRDRTLRLGDDEVNWRAYTEPFSPALWTAAAALLLSAAGLWTAMVAAASPESQLDTIDGPAARPQTSPPPEPLWTVLGVLVQQGAFVVPESASQRILLGSLWVFSVVLFASFTSNIVSLLASTRYVMPFETLEQLAALTDWKIIANPESADLQQLLRVRELNSTGKFEPIKAFAPAALEVLLTDDKSALFTAFSNIDHILRRNCSFVWSSIRVLPSAGYLTAQRHLPYGDALATQLTHLAEAGLLRRLWERTLLQPTAAGCRRLSQFNTMTLRQTAPALALLGVGLLAAVLVALTEWCWGRRRTCGKGRGKRKRSRKRVCRK